MFKALWFHQTCNSSQYFLRPLRSAFGKHVFLSDGKRRHCWSRLTVEMIYSAWKMPFRQHRLWYSLNSLHSNTPKLVSANIPVYFFCAQLSRTTIISPINSFEHKLWLKKHLAWHPFTPSCVCLWFSRHYSRLCFCWIHIFNQRRNNISKKQKQTTSSKSSLDLYYFFPWPCYIAFWDWLVCKRCDAV